IFAVASAAEKPTGCDTTFTVVFGDNTSACAISNDIVGLQPGQIITVVARYPVSALGHEITAAALDGGRVLGSKAQTVGHFATVQFQFQAGRDVGTYQLSLRDG